MPNRPTSAGCTAAATAFLMWGLLPVYWKALGTVPALEVLCHRIVWSMAFTGALLALTRGWGEVSRALRTPRDALLLAVSSVLIGANWLIFIWAVAAGHVLQASLGYYVNPLVNVLLGLVVFRERPRRVQWVAIVLAAAGVAVMTAGQGGLPWVSLALAVTFGAYGCVRKLMSLESLPGLFVETVALAGPAACWLIWLAAHSSGALFHAGGGTDALLVLAGPITALPLMLFAYGARRITLVTLGVLQYVAPTCMFLLGAFAYREPLQQSTLAAFALIWAGVLVYTADGVAQLRPRRG